MDDNILDLKTRVERLSVAARQRPNKQLSAPPAAKSPVFPVWPEAVRSAPNAILRSALFGVVRKGRRNVLDGAELVPSVKGVTIRIRCGQSLDQNDLDVWEEIVHLARNVQPGAKMYIPVRPLLQALGRAPGKPNREWLYGALERLYRCEIQVTMAKEGIDFEGPLIARLVIQKGQPISVRLDPQLPVLWEPGWTRQNMAVRRALGQNQLAKWLHSFYGTHKRPHPYKVETLRELCGSRTKELREFRRKIKNASKLVSKVTGWQMILDENDLLHVIKHGPKSVDN